MGNQVGSVSLSGLLLAKISCELRVLDQIIAQNRLVRGLQFHILCYVYYFFIVIVDVLFVPSKQLTMSTLVDSVDKMPQA